MLKLRERPRPPVGQDALARFARLVLSDVALRLARNKIEFGLEIPPLSDDPWEQYLVCEAMLVRYTAEAQAVEDERRAWSEARAEGQRAIDAYTAELAGEEQ